MKCICVFWLITKAITYPLWLAYRLFPTIPVSDYLYNFPPVVHLVLFIASICCLLLFIVSSNKRVAVFLFVIEIASCLLDENRWQPEIYLFIFLLICYISIKNEKYLLLCWQIIIVSSYFFSGWFKWHPLFISNVWQTDILRRFFHFKTRNSFILAAGYLIPIYEMMAGIGLCFNSSKKASCILIVLLHIFNLIWLGPFGLHSNVAVWPLNLIMPILVFNLFWNREMEFRFFKTPSVMLIIITIVWAILPLTNKFGYWDDFLSSEYYGGHNVYCYIDIPKTKAPLALHAYFIKSSLAESTDSSLLVVQDWSYGEMHVPAYPATWFYKKLAKQWSKKFDSTSKIFIIHYFDKKEIQYINQ
jgi:hypothetical protein